MCAQLARIDLAEVYRSVLARLPGLRLTVPLSEIRLTSGTQLGGGIAELPTSW